MDEWDYGIFWKEAMNQLLEDLGDQEFDRWFKLVEYRGGTENGITLAVPSAFYRDEVKRRYQNSIITKLKMIIGKDVSLEFEVIPRKHSEVPSSRPTASATEPEQPRPAPVVKRVQEKKDRHPQLREDYTFERYIIGDNNSFAANAATAISKNPGTAYNPYLIYGGVGLGKTHLMQAIGNYIHNTSDSKIIYISAENFTNEFIQFLRENKMSAFKNKYRFIDVLLLDDIYFLENKWESQEELFHTFNSLYDANKQMVFTSDRPVAELKKITDRLRSRFERGLNVDLQPPNYETRCAILKSKVQRQTVPVSDEVIALISKHISSNVRDLEAALTKLIAYTELVGKPITVQTAQQQLKDAFASPKQANLSIEMIQRVVADHHHLSFNDLKGKKKAQAIVIPRHLAMYITREITEFTNTEIGQAFGGRDHSTVMHACQKIEDRIRSDPTMDSTIQTLIRMVKEYVAKS
ncbi:MAG: chromosomal replication initiator protein DnaA [Treponema sp.]|nr:chromosomal replication initiator protein DnaA [Treponema sp.]